MNNYDKTRANKFSRFANWNIREFSFCVNLIKFKKFIKLFQCLDISLSTSLFSLKNTKLKSLLHYFSSSKFQLQSIINRPRIVHENTNTNNFKINEINRLPNTCRKSKYNNHRSKRLSKFSPLLSIPRKNKSKNDGGNVETCRKRSSPRNWKLISWRRGERRVIRFSLSGNRKLGSRNKSNRGKWWRNPSPFIHADS